MTQKNQRTIQTEIIIDAPKERVWEILVDFGKYPQWNPFMLELIGRAASGEKLKVTMQPPGQKPTVFKPVVQTAEPFKHFEWLGKMPINMFIGRHSMAIEELSEKRVRFIHSEQFSGWLAGFILKKVGNATREGFIAMNKALKEQAEQV